MKSIKSRTLYESSGEAMDMHIMCILVVLAGGGGRRGGGGGGTRRLHASLSLGNFENSD